MEHGYGGRAFPPPQAPPGQQQFPLHGAQQFVHGAAQPAYHPPPPPPLQFPAYHNPIPYPFVAPHVAPPIRPPPAQIPQSFFNSWETPPAFVPPPADVELQKRIDKLVEYAAKNGPEFENMLKEKQKENPAYSFLFGAEGHNYYRYRLWVIVNSHMNAFNSPMPPINPALSGLNPALSPPFSSLGPVLGSLNPPLNASLSTSLNPLLNSASVPPTGGFNSFYEQPHYHLQQQKSQPFYQRDIYPESDSKPFKGLSGPLPTDVAAELQEVLNNLTGTKESIKGAKTWFMQRSPFAPALAQALRDRVLALDDADRQLHVIYLANDILFDSLQRRGNIKELDNEALAFEPVLAPMLAAIYHNPQNRDANQTRLQKILQFWAAKEVFSKEIINTLEGEMVAGPSPSPQLPSPPKSEIPTFRPSNSSGTTMPSGAMATTEMGKSLLKVPSQWQPEQPWTFQAAVDQPEQEQKQINDLIVSKGQFIGTTAQFSSSVSQQFAANTVSSVYPSSIPFIGSLAAPISSVSQPTFAQLPPIPTVRAADHPPYPLFPPGLIPGMVRRMQIGSGVPYSALSPLDIPTVIPPSTVSDTYISERVSEFFKEIGEVNPQEGKLKATERNEEEDRVQEEWGRVGGARIPPPPALQVDVETNTLPDGSIDLKPGATSSGRLGLGATADPNEITQYDDVYTSYRKQQSTNYHTTMSARASTR